MTRAGVVLVVLTLGCETAPPKTTPTPLERERVQAQQARRSYLISDDRGKRQRVRLDPSPTAEVEPARDWTTPEPWEAGEPIERSHAAAIIQIEAAPSGAWVLSLDGLGRICSWTVRGQAFVLERCFDAEAKQIAALHGDKRFVVTTGRDIQMWGRGGVLVTRGAPFSAEVHLVEASPTSDFFVAAHGPELVLDENDFIASEVARWRLAAPAEAVVVSGERGRVTWYDAVGGVSTRDPDTGAIEALGWTVAPGPPRIARRFSRDAALLASVEHGRIVVQQAEGGAVTHRLPYPGGDRLLGLEWAGKEDLVAALGSEGAWIWALSERESPEPWVVRGELEPVAATLVTPTLVAASFDAQVVVAWR